LERISKNDMEYLIKNKELNITKNGDYRYYSGDQLVVTGWYGGKLKKQRYIQDVLFNKLQYLKSKEIIDLDNIKHNQRYLFSERVS